MEINKIKRSLLVLFFSFLAIGAQAQLEQAVKKIFAGDTFGGNVWLVNVQTGERHWLASDTKMKPDHAHPSFSPDGTKVLFQSGHFTNGKRLNLMMVDISSFK